MIKFIGVTKKYGDKTVLDDVSFSLPETGLIVLKGRNGSGKSTIINLLGCLDKPSSGSIIDGEVDLTTKDEETRRIYREQNIGFIFQENNLFENMTAEENIKITGSNPNFQNIAKFLGIEDLCGKKAKELSGGEQQRVAIARTLLRSTRIVLADEPTSSIDAESKIKILDLLKSMSKNVLVILVIHDNDLIPEYADEVLELESGKLIGIQKYRETEKENVAKPYKNVFNFRNFAKKNLFVNKKKLIRTSLLLIISFIFVLFATATASLDYLKLHADTMRKEQENMLTFYKKDEKGNYISFADEDIQTLSKEFSKDHKKAVGSIIQGNITTIMIPLNKNGKTGKIAPYYNVQLFSPKIFLSSTLDHVDFGRKPLSSNEMVINSYLAEQMVYYGVMTKEGTYYYPKDIESIINDGNEIMLFGGNNFRAGIKVSGITNVDLNKFTELKNPESESNKFNYFSKKSIYLGSNIFVNDSFFDLFKDVLPAVTSGYNFNLDMGPQNPYGSKYKYMQVKPFINPVTLDDETVINTLAENEVILGSNFKEHFQIGSTLDFIINYSLDLEENLKNIKVVGFNDEEVSYFNEKRIEKYLTPPISKSVLNVTENSHQKRKELLEKYSPGKHATYEVATIFTSIYEDLTENIKIISILFIVLSVIFGFMAFLYLYNYILNSIDAHKKDVAILKSLGIKTKEILSSFAYEIIHISLLSYGYALIAFLCLRIAANYVATNIVGFYFNIAPIRILFMITIIFIVFILDILIALKNNKKITKTSPQLLLKKTEL
ncbi:MAG TPA: hypothetical protein DCY94_00075 [Firmicutes bacterium]|nr:hypothetical protein [Bacillota bacterium]